MPSDNEVLHEGAERREYFRIDDDVYLTYRLLDEQTAGQTVLSTGIAKDTSRLARELSESSERVHMQLRNLKRKFPEVARTLLLLNEKIDLFMQLALAEQPESKFHPNMRVNLSATGMAFYSAAVLAEGNQVELEFKLFPSFKQIRAVARVVAVNEDVPDNAGRPYRIAVQFEAMNYEDREALKDHALSKQLARRRQQNR